MIENDNEEYQPAIYESEDDGSEKIDEETRKKAKPRKLHTYILKRIFEDQDKAKEWLQTEKSWSTFRCYETHAGRKQMLRCNKVPYRAQQCAASAYLLYNADSFQVILFESEEQHDHEEIARNVKFLGINSATKEAICALLLLKVTVPKSILAHLELEAVKNPEIKVPKIRQLYNFLQQKNKAETKEFKFDDLVDWCKRNPEILDNIKIYSDQAPVATKPAKARKRKAEDDYFEIQSKKRVPKQKPDFESDSEPPKSTKLIVRSIRNAARK